MSRRRQTARRIRDCKDLKVGTWEPNLRAGTRVPATGRRHREASIRDCKHLRKVTCEPNVSIGAGR